MQFPYVKVDFAADGDPDGVVTVTSTAGLFEGAIVWLNSDTQDPVELQIFQIISSTQLYLRVNNGYTYTYYNASAFTVADNATLTQPAQENFNAASNTVVAIEDESVLQGSANTLDFVGSGVSTSVLDGVATITVGGGAASVDIEEDSVAQGSADTLNFTTPLTASVLAAVATIGITDASATDSGVVTTGSQTFAGAKTFDDGILANSINTLPGDNILYFLSDKIDGAGGDPAYAFDTQNLFVSSDPIVAIKNSGANILTVDGSGNLNATGNLTGLNLSGTNTGDITLTSVGSAPNTNGASLTGQQLMLQPADATNPGVMTAGAQTLGGAKTFNGGLFSDTLTSIGTSPLTLVSGATSGASAWAFTLQTANDLDANNDGYFRVVNNSANMFAVSRRTSIADCTEIVSRPGTGGCIATFGTSGAGGVTFGMTSASNGALISLNSNTGQGGTIHLSKIRQAAKAAGTTVANDSIQVGFGATSLTASTTGTDTYLDTSGYKRHWWHTPAATPASGSLSFTAHEVNPTFNGTSSGTATAMAIAPIITAWTGGSVNLFDVGSTTTDYSTGYTSKFKIASTGKISVDTSDASGTPGNATINKASGQFAFAAAASSVTITNSLVTSTSKVFVQLQQVDATLTYIQTVVPGAGSFVVTANAAATANTKACFFVID